MTRSLSKATGTLYLLPVLAILGIWYALFFTGNPSAINPSNSIAYFLSDQTNERLWWFRWMLVGLPVLSLTLSFAYFSPIPKARMGAVSLFCAGVLLAAVAWITVSSALAGFLTAPLLLSFQDLRRNLAPDVNATPDSEH